MGREQLHAKIDQLGDPEAVVVERVVDAERIAIESTILAGSWLASPAWAEGFSARLRAHHALNVTVGGCLRGVPWFVHLTRHGDGPRLGTEPGDQNLQRQLNLEVAMHVMYMTKTPKGWVGR